MRYNRGTGVITIGERTVWAVGINDAQAESKIRGATLAGSYVNEVTVLKEEAFDQLYDRHSVEGAKIFGDTNPDSPYHWLKTKWLDNEALLPEDLYSLSFALTDNPYLPEGYVKRLMRSHTGLWKRRMIDGEWVVAEGAVYDMFDPDLHVVGELPESFERYVVGVDYGTANATVFLLLGKSGLNWYVLSEWRHDSREAGSQKTDEDYSRALIGWLAKEKVVPVSIEVDPSAASFKAQLARDRVRKVHDADNEVLDGIRNVSNVLSGGRLFIHESCEGLIKEMTNYRWDQKAQEKGEDKPVKDQDHGPDALRYAVQRIFGKQPQRALRLVK